MFPTRHLVDMVAFARDRLDFHPDPVQTRALDLSIRRGLLNCCRQWGKSTTVAIRAVHKAYHEPGSLTLVASPCARQSGEFVRKAAGYLRCLDIRPRGDGQNPISLVLPNGSRIVGLPGRADTTRGFSNVALLLFDEASRVNDEVYSALRPVIAANPNASIWLMSTPNGRQGYFYDQWSEGGAQWTRIQAPATECPRIPPEFLEEERGHHTDQEFRQEYLCEFVAADGAYFDPDAVADAFRKRPLTAQLTYRTATVRERSAMIPLTFRRMKHLLPFFLLPLAQAIDLTNATIVAPAGQKAVTILVEEVEKRTWRRWPISSQQPSSGPAIVIRNLNRAPAEGYTIAIESNSVRIDGNDARGVLFGVGHLLRALHLERNHAVLPDNFTITTAPKIALRGHQLGYRPKTNSYDGWDLRQWEQYIRELAIFGTNAIELIPPRSDDADDSPHFPASKIDTMIGMSRIAAEYGLDVWIWYPALDEDYSKPETVDFALKEWAEIFRKLPRIDAVFVPGGDPGHTHPKYLMPLLEKQTASLRRFHPKAQMWVAPQGFSSEWLAEFYSILRTGPQWLNGIVFGPQIRVSLAELRAAVPTRYPIRLYPDITHSLRAQYPVRDWDPAYQATLNREPINPRPEDQAAIFRQTIGPSIGFITYSEGCNDDVNKIVWSGLGWDPKADVTEILRDYGRFFIGAKWADAFAQGLLALERNWRGPLLTNQGVYQTLAQFQELDRQTPPQVHQSWRFQQAQYRAHYDAYNRARLLYETHLENEALAELRRTGSTERATAILDRAITDRASPEWRMRVFELGEALFQSIHMQLSVPYYKAIAVGRGANLDLIDTPLNDRPYLLDQFARKTPIATILNWTNPGPGGFYDDLGNSSAQPHLVTGLDYAQDPDHLKSPLNAMYPAPGRRQSWQTVAESRNDEPLRMRYRGLDKTAPYRVRVVYAGEDVPHDFRLTADGQYPVHDWMKKPKPIAPVEFDIPAAATADGDVTLEFERRPGIGGAGRAVQLAEVWLMRR